MFYNPAAFWALVHVLFERHSGQYMEHGGRATQVQAYVQSLAITTEWYWHAWLYTPLSESRSGLGGLLEDLGHILAVLAAMVSTI